MKIIFLLFALYSWPSFVFSSENPLRFGRRFNRNILLEAMQAFEVDNANRQSNESLALSLSVEDASIQESNILAPNLRGTFDFLDEDDQTPQLQNRQNRDSWPILQSRQNRESWPSRQSRFSPHLQAEAEVLRPRIGRINAFSAHLKRNLKNSSDLEESLVSNSKDDSGSIESFHSSNVSVFSDLVVEETDGNKKRNILGRIKHFQLR